MFPLHRLSAHIYSYAISFLSLLFFPLLLPNFHPLFFAPPLAIATLRSPLHSLLLQALLAGLLFDLFSTSSRFGMTGIAYALAAFFLYQKRYHLFEEKFSTFPIFTALLSLLIAFSMRLTAFFFGLSPPFSIALLFHEFFIQPIGNALFAILFFSLPWHLSIKFYRLTKKRRESLS